MERLKNGIYATAMNARIMKAYDEIEDEDLAESMLTMWLMVGVPDGNNLVDNVNDFGDKKDYDELFEAYWELCNRCGIRKVFYEEVEEIKKNIVEMLDNPYYNMV
jgi:sulfatase maturation enzyme AslB (radical SAM superfamily)